MNEIKEIFFPQIDAEAQKIIDAESLNSIYRLSFAGMIFMLLSMAGFLPTVELLMVCFIQLRPVFSVILTALVYACLYAVLYGVDGAQGFLLRNYAVLIVVSITGMVAVYHVQIRTSEKTVSLKKANALLAHANRHDPLTGLRNRTALREDLAEIVGSRVALYMIDVNCFKKINDDCGHMTGDAVLEEAGRRLTGLFPGGFCYRYGEDEFLVVCPGQGPCTEDTYRFPFAPLPDDILLSIGRAEGRPETKEQFYKLLAEADAKLYEVKRLTHSPAYGEHTAN